MPLTPCTSKGKKGWASHPGGHCFIGANALQRARNQLKAIKATQAKRKNTNECKKI